VCGPTNGPCNQNGCNGINSIGGAPGVCTAGEFIGCQCESICGDAQGSCDANGCLGVNGFCTAGDVVGCPCGGACK
jgi:hypothetical protein